jgi:hypothetical protein
MYIERTSRYYKGTEQRIRSARFLILSGPEDEFNKPGQERRTWCQVGFCQRWPDEYDDSLYNEARPWSAGRWIRPRLTSGPCRAYHGKLAKWRWKVQTHCLGDLIPSWGHDEADCAALVDPDKRTFAIVRVCDACKVSVERLNPTLGTWEPTGTRAPLRAFVRRVAMQQVGHFMMGECRLFGTTVTLSGSYGSDGLPKTLPRAIWERGLEVPQELRDAWNKGGGHNAAGNEAEAMAEWAWENLDKLESQRLGGKDYKKRKTQVDFPPNEHPARRGAS